MMLFVALVENRNRIIKVVCREMRISHRHPNRFMSQEPRNMDNWDTRTY